MNKQERIQMLKDVVNINSTNGNEEEVADYLLKRFSEYGILSQKVQYAEKRASLVCQIGIDTGKTLGFSGHMDVVDAGDVSIWKYPPFEATADDGKLYGRGATDMKSGLTAMAIAMMELKQEGKALNGTIKLLATVGEEVGELGAAQLTKEGFADDLDGLIIGEPTGHNIVYAHKGSMNYTVTSYGKNAHSSMPELGNNAINHLVLFCNEVDRYVATLTQKNEMLGNLTHNVTVINGGNQVNSIPEKATLQGNIRTTPEVSNERVEEAFGAIIQKLNQQKEVKLELVWDYNKQPVFSDKDSTLVKNAQIVAKKQLGEEMPLLGTPGTTDAAEFTKAKKEFPVIVFGPGNTTPHQVNEYVDIDNYLEMINVYKEIAVKFLD
ncbi:ArgE/DapE family deacylase [Listeria booriae]|uniref:ArgE/DapE family deacylase n=1 Tax=Listeria booriae TaxID=1552123 RepID=UPI0016259F28|nr:ArgE/DapE family deacylase [Listeria booriae]MBC2321815.1 ArgE/DapE family deacylase [Listeria booriae]MCD2205694.1 ArgE/DapE family deacylase [Listeria booriae]